METRDRTWYHLPVKAKFWKRYANFFKTGKINMNNSIEILRPEKCKIQPENAKFKMSNRNFDQFLHYL